MAGRRLAALTIEYVPRKGHAVLITPCTTYVLCQDGDFLLFVLRELLLGGHAPQLRVILMSATYAHPRLEPSSSLCDLPTLPSLLLYSRGRACLPTLFPSRASA